MQLFQVIEGEIKFCTGNASEFWIEIVLIAVGWVQNSSELFKCTTIFRVLFTVHVHQRQFPEQHDTDTPIDILSIYSTFSLLFYNRKCVDGHFTEPTVTLVELCHHSIHNKTDLDIRNIFHWRLLYSRK